MRPRAKTGSEAARRFSQGQSHRSSLDFSGFHLGKTMQAHMPCRGIAAAGDPHALRYPQHVV